MAHPTTGTIAAVACVLLLAAASGAGAASECTYANASDPWPASDWNWVMWGPFDMRYKEPSLPSTLPALLEEAIGASELFTLNGSLSISSLEQSASAIFPDSPYASNGGSFYVSSVPEANLTGVDLFEQLLPEDGSGLATAKRAYYRLLPGSHALAIFAGTDYGGLNITAPTTLSADGSQLIMGYYGFACASYIPRAIALATDVPADFNMTLQDITEVLPVVQGWLGDPAPGTAELSDLYGEGATRYTYWPLIVKATGEPVPLFIKFQWSFDHLAEAEQGVNSTGATLDVSTWWDGSEEQLAAAGLQATPEQVHADLARVLNSINDTIFAGLTESPAPAPAPELAPPSWAGAARAQWLLVAAAALIAALA